MQVISGNQRMLTNVVAGLGLLLAILLLVSEVSLAAAPRTTWTNSNGNDQWSDPGNWTNGAPVSGSVLIVENAVVQGPSTQPANNDLAISLKGLYFKGTGSVFGNSIIGSNISLLPSSQIKSVSDGLGFLNTDVIFQGRGAIRTSSTASVTARGQVHHGSDSLYLATYGTSIQSYESAFTGNGNLVISGSSDPNSLGGGVVFNDGVSVAGKTYVRYGGDLDTYNTTLSDLVVQHRGRIFPLQCLTVDDMTITDSTYEYYYIGNDNCASKKRGIFTNPGSTVKIKNSTLDLSVLPENQPAFGEEIILINNRGSRPIFGEFENAKEGTTITVDDFYLFSVTYKGGTGNDMVLTRI